MLHEPRGDALECSHNGTVQIFSVRRRGARALIEDVVTDPLNRTLALDRVWEMYFEVMTRGFVIMFILNVSYLNP